MQILPGGFQCSYAFYRHEGKGDRGGRQGKATLVREKE